jgi:hypothetical protein
VCVIICLSVCLSICLSIYLSIHPSIHPPTYLPTYLPTTVQPFVGSSPLFSFLILYTAGRTSWTGDKPVARPLPTHRINAHRHLCLEWDSKPQPQCRAGEAAPVVSAHNNTEHNFRFVLFLKLYGQNQ